MVERKVAVEGIDEKKNRMIGFRGAVMLGTKTQDEADTPTVSQAEEHLDHLSDSLFLLSLLYLLIE